MWKLFEGWDPVGSVRVKEENEWGVRISHRGMKIE
jgi:hypothetical protein